MPPRSALEADGAVPETAAPSLEPTAEPPDGDLEASVDRLHREARRVKRRNVERAIDRLADSRGLDDEQRAVLESLGDALVERVVGGPVGVLEVAARADDRETVRTGVGLFVDD